MIDIILEFYSKETEFLEKEFKVQLPEDMVFKASKTKDMELIKCLGWDITEDMASYLDANYEGISKDLQNFYVQFTGSVD